jgi:hypothetical protein
LVKLNKETLFFSRFPVKDKRVTFFDVPYGEREDRPEFYEFTPRNMQWAKLDANGIELNVFNTQGIWGFDGGIMRDVKKWQGSLQNK